MTPTVGIPLCPGCWHERYGIGIASCPGSWHGIPPCPTRELARRGARRDRHIIQRMQEPGPLWSIAVEALVLLSSALNVDAYLIYAPLLR